LRQPAVSQQLARLRADDLVEARREGKNIYYSLARSEVRDIIEALHRAFCKPRRAPRDPATDSPDEHGQPNLGGLSMANS
jgi:DNA-binding transcriptional ArsR family regulator